MAITHLTLNISENNGIPLEIASRAVDEVDQEFIQDFVLSLIADQQNDWWELKLVGIDGRKHRHCLKPNQQNVQGIKQILRRLNDSEK